MGNTTSIFGQGAADQPGEATPHGGEGDGGTGGHTVPPPHRLGEGPPCCGSVVCVPRPDEGPGCWTCCELPAGWTVGQACDLLLLLSLLLVVFHHLAWPLLPVLRAVRAMAVAVSYVIFNVCKKVIDLFGRRLFGGDNSQRASTEATGRPLPSKNQVTTVKACAAAVLAVAKISPKGDPSPKRTPSSSAAANQGPNEISFVKTEEIIEEEIIEEEIIMDEIQSEESADGSAVGYVVDGRVNESEKRQMWRTPPMAGNNSQRSTPKQLQDGEETRVPSSLAMLANISEQMHLIMENQRDHGKQLEELQMKVVGAHGRSPALASISAVPGGGSDDAKPGSPDARSPRTSKNR